MPNNNPNIIDFSYLMPISIRNQFEQAELARIRGDFDGALKRINTLNMRLYGSYYLLGSMPIILLLCIHIYNLNNEENKTSNYQEILLAFLALSTIRLQVRDPLSHILKNINVYRAFLYQQKGVAEIDACASIADPNERSNILLELLVESSSAINKNLRQALVFAETVGFSSHDTVLLQMAASSQTFSLQNAEAGLGTLMQRLLDANVDPNCVLPGQYTDGQTIVFNFALSNNWRAVNELLDRFPDLDVAICPQDGVYKGQSVLAISALNNQWDICARIISSFSPNLNQIMEGSYKNRDKDCFGKQPIWVLAKAGKSQLVRAMINKGAIINAESLKKIITCCDKSVIEFGIEKGAFTRQQVIELFANCEFVTSLLSVIVDLSLWEELQIVLREESPLSDSAMLKISKKFKEYSDTRYMNLLSIAGSDEVKRRITLQLRKEVAENVIIKALLEYSSDTIRAFINLDSTRLQEMFDVISNLPTIVDPVRVTSTQNTTNLYERSTITAWVREQYTQDHATGNIMQSEAAHPENRESIDLDSLVELSSEDKGILAGKVRTIMSELVVEAKNQRRLKIA